VIKLFQHTLLPKNNGDQKCLQHAKSLMYHIENKTPAILAKPAFKKN